MPIEKLKPSFFFDEERLKEFRAIVPEAFTDGKINWETLKEALGEHLEDEGRDVEHFGLFWPGKREARRLASIPSKGTLVPVKGEGINEDSTGNIFIDGENLEVLKILRKSYAGRIKMIYIDPPYNTGNDFVYDDNFTEPLEEYLRRTGQTDEEGRALTTNKKSDGRFHSKWLSMMYPRLKLARELLRDDGVIFISIDDNEVHNLRMLMNEIYGEENFIACIAWEKRYTRSNNARMFYSLKDSIILFRKSDTLADIKEPRTKKSDSIYSNIDDDPRGPWTSSSFVNPATKEKRPNLYYPLINPFTKKKVVHPTHSWKYEKKEYERLSAENRLWWGKNGEAQYPRMKVFLSEAEGGIVPIDLWDYKSSGTTDEGGNEVKELFGCAVFDNPKPTKLIKKMLGIVTSDSNDDIILDFFSGSCSTAHAIVDINKENDSNLKYIMVQIPEITDELSEAYKANYKTISEIGKERIRRVLKNIVKENKEQKKNNKGKLPGMVESTPGINIGFKVYKLTNSSFKPWENYHGEDIDVIEDLFSGQVTPLVDDWTEDDLFTEVMLLEGFPLDSIVKPCKEYKSNTVKEVSSSFSDHKLFISLDKKINQTTIKDLNLGENDIFVCLDSAVNDEAKARLADKGLIKTI